MKQSKARRFVSLALLLAVTAGADGAHARPAGKKGARPVHRSPAAAAGGSPAAGPAAAPAPGEPAAEDRTEADAKPGGAVALGEGAPEPAAKPAPAPAAKPSPAPPPAPASAGPSPDLERLRADYDRLRDDLFRSRARAQIAEDALYKSKLSATFRWKGAPNYVLHHAAIRLDGGEIWDSGDKNVTDDLVTVAERGVKPGPHALTLRIDIRPGKKSKDSDKLGYVSEHTFAIIVPDGMRTRVAIVGDEDGDAPEYQPEIEVELESEK
jgi:hypothetical protein